MTDASLHLSQTLSGSNSGATLKRTYLSSKFVVGSARSDRINFSQAQKVFHSGDVKVDALEAKKDVTKKKQPNILASREMGGTSPRSPIRRSRRT